VLWPAPGEADALVAELARFGFTLAESRGLAARGEPQPVAIASLRGALRKALDPQGVMAFGERWESGGAG